MGLAAGSGMSLVHSCSSVGWQRTLERASVPKADRRAGAHGFMRSSCRKPYQRLDMFH